MLGISNNIVISMFIVQVSWSTGRSTKKPARYDGSCCGNTCITSMFCTSLPCYLSGWSKTHGILHLLNPVHDGSGVAPGSPEVDPSSQGIFGAS
jgi:hypothetical protein